MQEGGAGPTDGGRGPPHGGERPGLPRSIFGDGELGGRMCFVYYLESFSVDVVVGEMVVRTRPAGIKLCAFRKDADAGGQCCLFIKQIKDIIFPAMLAMLA